MEKIYISNFALPEPITRAGTAGIARAAYVLPQRRSIVLFWPAHKNQMRQTMHSEKCLITSQVLEKAVNRAFAAGELDFKTEVPWIDIEDSDFD